jgi:hypothetical protein
MFKKFTISAAAAATALVALPTAAQARHNDYGSRYDRYEQRYDDRYADRRYDDRGYNDRTYRGDRSDRRCSGTTGTIVGGAGGALAGRAIDRSGRRGGGLTGTIIGGAIGALAGRAVDKSGCRNSGLYYR